MEQTNSQNEKDSLAIAKYVKQIKIIIVDATIELKNPILLLGIMLTVVSDFITSFAKATESTKANVSREFFKMIVKMLYENKDTN